LVYLVNALTILGLFLFIRKAQKIKNRELLYKQHRQLANEEIYNLMISQQAQLKRIEQRRKKSGSRAAWLGLGEDFWRWDELKQSKSNTRWNS
jgi:hypothetical protein